MAQEASDYQVAVESFLNHPQFGHACRAISKRARALRSRTVERIWELHVSGLTQRAIAAQVKRSKTCVAQTLEKLKTWMRLL